MKKYFNLQLFDNGGEGGSGGGQGGNAGDGNGSQGNAGNNGGTGGYSFQQAEEIAQDLYFSGRINWGEAEVSYEARPDERERGGCR